MSYLNEKQTSLIKRNSQLRKQRDVVLSDRTKHPKDRERIVKAIERDIAYTQKEQAEVYDLVHG